MLIRTCNRIRFNDFCTFFRRFYTHVSSKIGLSNTYLDVERMILKFLGNYPW
jgi:hypothetical protein